MNKILLNIVLFLNYVPCSKKEQGMKYVETVLSAESPGIRNRKQIF